MHTLNMTITLQFTNMLIQVWIYIEYASILCIVVFSSLADSPISKS